MDIFGHTDFCEDLRQEASGQISMVGCFTGDIIISSNLPSFVQKLAIITFLYISKTKRFKEITINAYLDDDKDEPDISIPIDIDESQWSAGEVYNKKGEQLYLRVQNNLILNGFHLTKETDIVIRSNCDGIVTRIGKIKVLIANEESGQTVNLVTVPMGISALKESPSP